MMHALVRTVFGAAAAGWLALAAAAGEESLEAPFRSPPPSAWPGVYWYFMDGNRTAEGMTADLESMREAGIGNLVFLEVNVGVPRGPVDFLSDRWQELFCHAVREAERLGIQITLGSGPGWAGSGGPWVKLEQSMKHLVARSVEVTGPGRVASPLPRPAPREPYFGYGALTERMRREREAYYEDVAVLAFPTPREDWRIEDIDEKALYERAPYTSRPGVKPYLPARAAYSALPADAVINRGKIVDLTSRLGPDGRLDWEVPPGSWTILRFGVRNTGATTRPAPQPGLGFECDKLDAAALDAHLAAYLGELLAKVGPRQPGSSGGWTMLHIDSWEMGAQNWTAAFREEFRRRRGYDPLPLLPVYTGRVVDSLEVSERFLWDVRLTAQELVLENHAGRLREFGRRHGMGLSIEPYDMNPTSDLELGAVADVPMGEFWSEGYGFDSSFSCFEAVSVAHTNGRPVVAAEAFTADHREAWRLYPGAMKNQGDWAFAAGINRLVYHTFAHKPHGRRPGMTMGPYGVHWDRGQTWWPMVGAYHRYVARCQFLLRQGAPVADICYLAGEGAPHVFRPPPSALEGAGSLRDRRGYNFDGCSPKTLIAKAAVENGRITFPGGAAYRVLVLPALETMTPGLLRKIQSLLTAGATVIGPPPLRSPSLEDYPECDAEVQRLARAIWGSFEVPQRTRSLDVGRGRLIWGGPLSVAPPGQGGPPAIAQARWIWFPEKEPATAAPPGTRYFHRAIRIDPEKRLRSARVAITADNTFDLWVNGQRALAGSDFHAVHRADVTRLLKPGDNTLAVQATNGGEEPNPAGLVAALHVVYQDGTARRLVTDGAWQVASGRPEDWPSPSPDRWAAARVLGPVGMRPWRLSPAEDPCPHLYPDYDATAQLLGQLGCPPDFEADGPIRYTHRRTPEADIYFVASRDGQPVSAVCRFRVTGRRPQLWDPLTGTIRSLPEHAVEGAHTAVPMRFEPYQSFFVVFQEPAAHPPRTPPAGPNFPEWQTAGELAGPWQVTFDPRGGGPGAITLAELTDWTKRPEPGVKYYSGIAVYRKRFDLPRSCLASRGPILLDLGTVHNLARVRLNGADLGVLWCAPWRVEITATVRPRENHLEIEVANLWPNRLIGDRKVPAEDRVAWTTFNPYRADSPLLASGLLGPVTFLIPAEGRSHAGVTPRAGPSIASTPGPWGGTHAAARE